MRKIIIPLSLLIVINILSHYWFTRFDFTSDKRYSLSPISKEILSHIHKDLTITVYLNGEMPAGFKRLRQATEDMLLDFETYAKGNLHIKWIDPNAETNENKRNQLIEKLIAQGIDVTNLSVKTENGLSQKLIFLFLDYLILY